jgi:hypothetical protein
MCVEGAVLVDGAALVEGAAAVTGAAVFRGAVYVGLGAIGAAVVDVGAAALVVGGGAIGSGATGGEGGTVDTAAVLAGSTELGAYAGVFPGGSIRTTPTMIATTTPSALITSPRTDTCRWSQCLVFPRMGGKITAASWRLPVWKTAKPLCNSGFHATCGRWMSPSSRGSGRRRRWAHIDGRPGPRDVGLRRCVRRRCGAWRGSPAGRRSPGSRGGCAGRRSCGRGGSS